MPATSSATGMRSGSWRCCRVGKRSVPTVARGDAGWWARRKGAFAHRGGGGGGGVYGEEGGGEKRREKEEGEEGWKEKGGEG